MKRILVTGAGGSAATNFVRSLRQAPEGFHITGIDANKYHLMRAEVDRRHLVPRVDDPSFLEVLAFIIEHEEIGFIHAQNDGEVDFLSMQREALGTRTFLPSKETIRLCQDKFASYQKWERAGLRVPNTMLLRSDADLKDAFQKYAGKLWLRAIAGAGGTGSLPVSDYATAESWLSLHKGWGHFTASELLEPESVTWMSIWRDGELVVAQGRKRLYWELSKISPSGITGATGAGETVSEPKLDEVAMATVLAVDAKPHGLFGVDLTYDASGVPNPTEINIGRFFTTHQFFTDAGLNMPYIFTRIAYGEQAPELTTKLNPVEPGLVWIRGMDFEPVLTSRKAIEENVESLNELVKRLHR
jgi:carbamoyl-phosphate synthase large subunit